LLPFFYRGSRHRGAQSILELLFGLLALIARSPDGLLHSIRGTFELR